MINQKALPTSEKLCQEIYNTKSTTRNWYAHLLRRRVELRGAELGARSPSSGRVPRAPARCVGRFASVGAPREATRRSGPSERDVDATGDGERRSSRALSAKGRTRDGGIRPRHLGDERDRSDRRSEKGGVAKFTFVGA